MQRAQAQQLQHPQICRFLAPCLRGSSWALHNRRPIDVLFPKINQSLFLVGDRVAGLPEVARYHFLVKRKLGSILSGYEDTASTQGVAQFDETVGPFAR